jgi:hypothetical protein
VTVPLRRVTAAVLGILASALVLLVLPSVPAAASPRPESVVVVGVAGLRWDDVDDRRTPTLAGLARSGSVGALSVRSAPAVTCPGEGWLTLGSGTYAALEDPAATDPDAGCAQRGVPTVQQRGRGAVLPTFPLHRRLNEALRFGARPGLLGSAAGCVSAAGPGAALAGADGAGVVTAYTPELPADPGRVLRRCPLVLVDLGVVPGGRGRTAALARMDDDLRRIAAARPAGSVLLVAGLAEADTHGPRLHVLVADGPGYRGGWVHSPSTRRTPYAQLSDLGPTALALLGRDLPGATAGRPLSGEAPGRPGSWAGTRRVLTDADLAATGQREVVAPFFVLLGLVSLACYLVVLPLLRRPGHRLRTAAAVACAALAAVPGATFLAHLAPWWRAPGGAPGAVAALVAACAVAAAALTAVTVLAYRRGGPGTALGVLGGGTFAVVVLDLLTGGRLQLDSMLGYNPLVAGRFVGIGNIAFAVLGVAALFLAAALATGRSRWTAFAAVTAVAAVTVTVDGSPALGADFGGVLTLVPAFGVLALAVLRTAITPLRVAVAGAAGVLVVAALGAADFLRPEETRSHFGGFVHQVLGGEAGEVLRRKSMANLDLLLAGPHTVAAFVASVVLAVLVLRPPRALAGAYAAVPPLRPALLSVVVLGAVGFATNDSGVGIPAVAAVVAVPAALAACLLAGRDAVDDTPPPGAGEPVQVLP